MLSISRVSAALNDAFDDLTSGPDDGTYLSVSAAWTNPAGKLISMHISVGDADEDHTDASFDVQRPRLSAVDDTDPDYI